MKLNEQLQHLTEKLLSYNDQLLTIAEETRNREAEPDFFLTVKPFADEVKQVVDEWKAAALKWVTAEKPKHVHIFQIETLCENIEKLSVEAFYRKERLSRMKQFHQSIEYTLNLVKSRLQNVPRQ